MRQMTDEIRLCEAARDGKLAQVRHYLKKRVNINYKDNGCNNYSPLYHAIWQGRVEVVSVLLEHNADVTQETLCHDTALQVGLFESVANISTIRKIIDLLLLHGAKFDAPLLEYCYHNNVEAFLDELRHTDVNQEYSNGYTVMHYACALNLEGLIKQLIDRGGDVNKGGNSEQVTPLHISAHHGHLKAVQQLLAHGASLSKKVRLSDFTPLLYAVLGGHIMIVQYLVEQGASLSDKDSAHNTLLLRAASSGHLEIVRWLLENGASITERNYGGDTALICAARGGHLEISKYLVEHGVSISNKNKSGKTALIMAKKYGHEPLTNYLCRYSMLARTQDKKNLSKNETTSRQSNANAENSSAAQAESTNKRKAREQSCSDNEKQSKKQRLGP